MTAAARSMIRPCAALESPSAGCRRCRRALMPRPAPASFRPRLPRPDSALADAPPRTRLQFAAPTGRGRRRPSPLDAATPKSKTGGYPFQGATPNADPAPARSTGRRRARRRWSWRLTTRRPTPWPPPACSGSRALSLIDTPVQAAAFDTKRRHRCCSPSRAARRRHARRRPPTQPSPGIKAACTGTINGIVLGGTAAIPDTVLNQFKARLAHVARIAGVDR